mgnify:CR=1 FL=1
MSRTPFEAGDEAALYMAAVAFVLQTGRPSASKIQRAFSIGYLSAVRVIERMEAAGVVSAPDAEGRRKITRAYLIRHAISRIWTCRTG